MADLSIPEGHTIRLAGLYAGEDITKYRFVRWTSAGSTTMADDGHLVGISEDTIDDTKSVPVCVAGVTFLEVNANGADNNIAVGDFLTGTNNGIGVLADTDLQEIGAVALDSATADGVHIPVVKISGIYGV